MTCRTRISPGFSACRPTGTDGEKMDQPARRGETQKPAAFSDFSGSAAPITTCLYYSTSRANHPLVALSRGPGETPVNKLMATMRSPRTRPNMLANLEPTRVEQEAVHTHAQTSGKPRAVSVQRRTSDCEDGFTVGSGSLLTVVVLACWQRAREENTKRAECGLKTGPQKFKNFLRIWLKNHSKRFLDELKKTLTD